MHKLRDYQQNAIDNTQAAFDNGANGVFLCLPTGGGKTVIFTDFIKRWQETGKRSVVVAHRLELIKQAGKTIERNGMYHGVIKAGPSTFPLAPIQVVSIDSMRSRELPWEPDLIILDEAHLAKAKRYKTFLEKYPKAKRLLVSATPIRTDGTGFQDIADELIVGATIKELIEHPEGPFLVYPRIYTGSELHGLENIKKTAGDYNQGQLENLMSSVNLIGDIVDAYKRLAMGRKGVVFCVGINHSKLVSEQFNQAGIKAEHLDGTMDEVTRGAILGRLHNGETQIVTNAAVLCEGWDEPSIAYVGLARPTQSIALYIQQAGRGLRIDPENPDKTDCVIVDHGQNVERLGHILEERTWSLVGRKFKEKPTKKFKTCAICQAWIKKSAQKCEYCGHEIVRQSVEVITTQAEFKEVGERLKPVFNEVQIEYRKLLRFARMKDRKPGWAYFKCIEKFGKDMVSKNLTFGESKRYQAECYWNLPKPDSDVNSEQMRMNQP